MRVIYNYTDNNGDIYYLTRDPCVMYYWIISYFYFSSSCKLICTCKKKRCGLIAKQWVIKEKHSLKIVDVFVQITQNLKSRILSDGDNKGLSSMHQAL